MRPWDTVAYIGDSLEAVWILSWNAHQLFENPLRVLDANILYPTPSALTYTDHRIGTALLVTPILWLTHNPVLAYNVALALGCLLAAYAGRRFALSLGILPIAAWVAGALYGFHTYQINEGPRLHLIYHGFLPLALEQLIRYLKTGATKHAFFVAGWMLLQGFFSSYLILYGALLLTIVVFGTLLFLPKLVAKRMPWLIGAALTATVLFLPILLPYLATAKAYGLRHELPIGVDLVHYFSTPENNVLYGPIGAEVRIQQGASHFVGFVSLALVLIAVLAWTQKKGGEPKKSLLPVRVWVPCSIVLSLFFVALSLGKDAVLFNHHLGPGPYQVLYHWVPGFQQVRIPERLSLLAMFFVALLVGRSLSLIEARRFKWAVWPLAVLVPLEHVAPLAHSDRIPIYNDVPAVYKWISDNPVRALAEVPVHGEGLIRKETLEMYFSYYHGFKPIIHGYESFPPLLTSLLRKVAADFPSKVCLQAFQRVGVDTVIFHLGREGSDQIEEQLIEQIVAGRLSLAARFGKGTSPLYDSKRDEVYRVEQMPVLAGANYPSGHRLIGNDWSYRTKVGDPLPAVDGDLSTQWIVPRTLNGDEFFEVTFPEPLIVSGIVIRLLRNSAFPNHFKVAGRQQGGEWVPLTWFDDAHKLQLLDNLLQDPARASIGFDLGHQELTGLRIMVEEGGTSFAGWSIPEIEVWVP